MSDPVETVRRGYDAIADAYLAWNGPEEPEARSAYVHLFVDALHEGADVLDLGCGAGVPVAKTLAERFRVTGVDVSARQLELARSFVPAATLVQGDMCAVDFPDATFDGVIAVHSITHVPRDRHAALFARIYVWLRVGGLFVACLGADDSPGGVDDDWLGAPMYFSHYDADENRRLLLGAGFALERDEVVSQVEHSQECRFLWVAARKT